MLKTNTVQSKLLHSQGKEILLPLFCCFGINLALKSWQLPDIGLRGLATDDLGDEWNLFKKTYNKTYIDGNEEVKRYRLFRNDLSFIKNSIYLKIFEYFTIHTMYK